MPEERKFLSFEFSPVFIQKFNLYLKKKQKQIYEKEARKISQKEMIAFAINDMIERDSFKRD